MGQWLCWDVGPALFSKVTLYHKCSVGAEICQKYGPAAREAEVLRATTEKGRQLF